MLIFIPFPPFIFGEMRLFYLICKLYTKIINLFIMRKLLSFILLLFCATTLSAQETNNYFIVKTDGSNMRQTPSTKGKIIKKLPSGVLFKTLEVSNGWYKFEINKGETAYLSKKVVTPLTASVMPNDVFKSETLYGWIPQGDDIEHTNTLYVYELPNKAIVFCVETMRTRKNGSPLPALSQYFVGTQVGNIIEFTRSGGGFYDNSKSYKELMDETDLMTTPTIAVWDNNAKAVYFYDDVFTVDPQPVSTDSWE